MEKLRGWTTAAAFAQRHHAGTADEHIGRYRLLADRGVTTVFVSLPHLAEPEDVLGGLAGAGLSWAKAENSNRFEQTAPARKREIGFMPRK